VVEEERLETDSSEDERAAMDAADAPADAEPAPPPQQADAPNRPSFLAV
jgi:hypothetical protein